MPNRAESKRGAPNVIISIAQHARPKVAGQKDALRMYPTSPSTVVSITPAGSFSSSPMSVPIQSAATPDVGIGDEDGDHEQEHLDQSEPAERIKRHGERVEKDDLDVEDDEQHRDDEVAHRDPATADRHRTRLDARLVAIEFGPVVATRAGERRDADAEHGEPSGQGAEDENRRIGVHSTSGAVVRGFVNCFTTCARSHHTPGPSRAAAGSGGQLSLISTNSVPTPESCTFSPSAYGRATAPKSLSSATTSVSGDFS